MPTFPHEGERHPAALGKSGKVCPPDNSGSTASRQVIDTVQRYTSHGGNRASEDCSSPDDMIAGSHDVGDE